MSVTPISPVAAVLRVQLLGAMQDVLGEVVSARPIAPRKDGSPKDRGQQDAALEEGGEARAPQTDEAETEPGRTQAAQGPTRAQAAAPSAQTPPRSAGPAPNPAQQAVIQARASAAGRQDSAAPLFAHLPQALDAPGLPPAARQAAAQLLAQRLPVSAELTAPVLRQAVAQSGLFLEARLAAAVAPGPASPQSRAAPDPRTTANPPPYDPKSTPDLKAALLILRQALATLAPAAPLAMPTPTAPALPPSTLAAAAPPPAAPPVQAAPADPVPTGPPPGTTPTKTPPPLRDAALAGQPPATPMAPADGALDLPKLRQEVDQALARQTLHQLASLPEPREPQAGAVERGGWMFELPMATPQGAAIAQFAIDRDGHAAGADPASVVWRVRFSLDVEPLGPVHVQLTRGAGRTAVTLWAEREESLQSLRAHGDELARDLAADVAIHPGSPRKPAPAAGQFIDRLS